MTVNEYGSGYKPPPDRVDPEDRERDKPLCLRARAELPLLGIETSEVERRILLAALVETKGSGRRISYSRNKNHYPGKARYKGRHYTYKLVPAVDRLVAQGLLGHAVALPWPCGWQSTPTGVFAGAV